LPQSHRGSKKGSKKDRGEAIEMLLLSNFPLCLCASVAMILS
jgi:hypothetical protein